MSDFFIVSILVFAVALTMTMVGKAGGNFYVVILAIANIPMHQAAATSLFILFSASIAAIFIFQKNKSVSWTLAALISSFTALTALAGGYLSHLLSSFILKIIFTVMLIIGGIAMLVPVSKKNNISKNNHTGIINIKSGNEAYRINLWIVLPITILTGFVSGMVGISGGSIIVPLMVLACGVPMHVAVGTASTLIAATSLMGFAGHAVRGDFNPSQAIPLAIVTVAGGIIGGKFSLNSNPGSLKKLFAYTNWLAAVFMIYNAFHAN